FFQAEDGIRDLIVTGVQTCALPICTQPLSVVEFCHRFDGLLSSLDASHKLGLAVSGSSLTVGKCWQVTSEHFQHAEVAELADAQIGRASCRERVMITELDEGIKNKT